MRAAEEDDEEDGFKESVGNAAGDVEDWYNYVRRFPI